MSSGVTGAKFSFILRSLVRVERGAGYTARHVEFVARSEGPDAHVADMDEPGVIARAGSAIESDGWSVPGDSQGSQRRHVPGKRWRGIEPRNVGGKLGVGNIATDVCGARGIRSCTQRLARTQQLIRVRASINTHANLQPTIHTREDVRAEVERHREQTIDYICDPHNRPTYHAAIVQRVMNGKLQIVPSLGRAGVVSQSALIGEGGALRWKYRGDKQQEGEREEELFHSHPMGG